MRFSQTALVLTTAISFAWSTPNCPLVQAAPRADGRLKIEVVDSKTDQPIAARMHLKNARGRPVELRLPGTAEFGGHCYVDGRLTLPLRIGQYTFELDAGPEYRPQSGHFEIDRHADDSQRIEMERFANLAEEGWFGGDLDVSRRLKELPLVMRAEGLNIARDARKLGGHVVARTPYAWHLPVWLASGQLDAIQLIHHHSLRDGVADDEDDGRPRDRSLYPGRSGNGRWSEAVYYHVLNCGLRMPPAAGSGSGTNDNPIGTNRVYVYCGDEFSDERWWEGLAAGRVFVTNGPLLRPLVEGRPPGYVFHLDAGGSLMLEIGLNLATRVPVEYLQIVKNGRAEAEVRLADWKSKKGRLPPIAFDESGWFLVRAVTNNERTYQFASTGPYYVERAGRPRVSRRSVEFFLAWIDAATKRLGEMPGLDDAARDALLAEQESARWFFKDLLAAANVE